jgi:hypothetical protein
MSVPFLTPKTRLDKLVDVLLSLPEYVILAESMLDTRCVLDCQESIHKLQANLSTLISTLDNENQNDGTRAQYQSSLAILSQEYRTPQPVSSSDSYSGSLVVICHAAYLICFSLLARLATEVRASSGYQTHAIFHSGAALGAADYVDICSQSPASSLYISTVFSLKVVVEWSPSQLHREYALKKLENSTVKDFKEYDI